MHAVRFDSVRLWVDSDARLDVVILHVLFADRATAFDGHGPFPEVVSGDCACS